jgi:hypothetical protein
MTDERSALVGGLGYNSKGVDEHLLAHAALAVRFRAPAAFFEQMDMLGEY